ncbi:MAG TPA: UvrD-helicase domain-containing protein [Vicinamibacterales bacterium]|nr:UvrD-helicase domain-containing protein [Vicinamibacterales bacterium]
MEFLAQLNPAQREAVLHPGGPLLVVAGAGSGKTRVITCRIVYLVRSGLVAPDRLLAVTFTNKAADEMRARVEALGGAACRGVWLSTFHAFCARVLRRDGPAIGLPRDFVIYDADDQVRVMRRVMRQLNIDERVSPPRQALARISHAKNRMETPAALAAAAGSTGEERLARLYAGYAAALAESGALDFDDLLLRTVELFETRPEVRAAWASRFDHILVDEYQDTNRPQYLLILHLAREHGNLCVVGDPDQSIYQWRGADLRNILDFEHDFPQARIVRLEQNYRSTQTILDAAAALIRHNRRREDKRLWTTVGPGDPVVYVEAADEIGEANFIARLAAEVSAAGETLAVLYRTNAQSRAIEDALMRERVPYRVVGGVRFYERREIKDALAFLRVAFNPHDDVSLGRIINVPPRGIGRGVLEALEAIDAAGLPAGAPRSLWTRILYALDHRALPPRALAVLEPFRALVAELAAIVRTDPPAEAVGKVLDRTGYLAALREERSAEAEGRIENLRELASAAGDYASREPQASLAGFVDRLSLLSESDEEAGPPDARVSLMTLHAAKGLEFPMVVIAGMEEGLCPHTRSQEGDELEEERRLCYVGMTRARERLVLTGAARRRIFGEYQTCQPSRFLSEIPRALVRVVRPAGAPAPAPRPLARPSGGLRRPAHRPAEDAPRFYAYEAEDQSCGEIRPGMRVRHAEFGEGTIVAVEPQAGDLKLTILFPDVGRKKVMARYARLEPA